MSLRDHISRTRSGLSRMKRKGQTMVEYMLMLATIAGMALTFGALFYKQLLGGFFTMVGLIIGAGTPT